MTFPLLQGQSGQNGLSFVGGGQYQQGQSGQNGLSFVGGGQYQQGQSGQNGLSFVGVSNINKDRADRMDSFVGVSNINKDRADRMDSRCRWQYQQGQSGPICCISEAMVSVLSALSL